MKRTALILCILFSTVLFALPKNGDDINNGSELVEHLLSIVTPILQGNEYTEFRKNISPEAYVISNNSYESIFEVLSNPIKKEKFVEGIETKTGFVRLLLLDNQKEAHLILETKSSDNTKTSWHSILFKISENDNWQILSWHKS